MAAEEPRSAPRRPPLSAAARALGLACPHCGLRAMSAPRKWLSGWGGDGRACAACGQRVEPDGLRVMLVTAPFILACLAVAVWAGIHGGIAWRSAAAVLVLLAALGGLGYVFGVPLSRIGRTDPERAAAARRRAGLPD